MKELESKKLAFFERYNISENEVIDSIADVLRKKLGFEVKEMELPQDIDGAILVDSKGKLTKDNKPIKKIVVSSKIDKLKQRFTVAHEFAHYIINDNREILAFRDHSRNRKKLFSDNELEDDVDYMAASILMPKDSFYNELIKLKSEPEVIKYLTLYKKFRVEFHAIFYREQEVEALNNV